MVWSKQYVYLISLLILFLKQLGFKHIYADAWVYNHLDDHNGFVIFSLYMDDMLLLLNNVDLISKIKKLLSSRFHMGDQSEAHYILRMIIKYD